MTDREIIELIQSPKTKEKGYDLLITTYQKRVYWHIRRMVIDHDDANDLTQDTFIRVYNNLDKFRQESKLYTWIYRIATNISLNHLSAKKRRLFLPLNDIKGELISKLDQSELVTGDVVEKKLQKALLELPEKQRLVFNMKYYENMNYEEIAEITKTSVGALKASYHHAVTKIKKYLSED